MREFKSHLSLDASQRSLTVKRQAHNLVDTGANPAAVTSRDGVTATSRDSKSDGSRFKS